MLTAPALPGAGAAAMRKSFGTASKAPMSTVPPGTGCGRGTPRWSALGTPSAGFWSAVAASMAGLLGNRAKVNGGPPLVVRSLALSVMLEPGALLAKVTPAPEEPKLGPEPGGAPAMIVLVIVTVLALAPLVLKLAAKTAPPEAAALRFSVSFIRK